MKYRKSDNVAIFAVVAFILAIVLGPKTAMYMGILGVLALAAIVLTILLKIFYFGRSKYIPSRKRPKEKEDTFYLDKVQPLNKAQPMEDASSAGQMDS